MPNQQNILNFWSYSQTSINARRLENTRMRRGGEKYILHKERMSTVSFFCSVYFHKQLHNNEVINYKHFQVTHIFWNLIWLQLNYGICFFLRKKFLILFLRLWYNVDNCHTIGFKLRSRNSNLPTLVVTMTTDFFQLWR